MKKEISINKTIKMLCIVKMFSILFLNPTIASDIESKSIQLDSVSFQIDPRFELYNIVGMLIPDWPFSNGLDLKYKKDVNNYFLKHKSHPTVANFKSNWMKSFQSIDAPVEFLLSCDNSMQPNQPFNDIRDTLAASLHQFMIDSEFSFFFKSQSDFYEMILSIVKYNFSDFKERERIVNYYGYELNSYTCILNTLGVGNFGIGIDDDNDNFDSYICLSPSDAIGDIPVWDNSYRTYNLIWHEFSHTYVNPLVDKFKDNVMATSYLYEPIKASMSSQAYQDWTVTVKEHMVRAVAARLAAQKYGSDAAYLNHQRGEFGRRFIYINYILDILEQYEEQDLNFDSYFLKILKAFSNVDTSKIDSLNLIAIKYREPLTRSIHTLNEFPETDELAIIYPTKITDTTLKNQLFKSIEQFRNNYYKNQTLIADTAAIEETIGDKVIIVFGTKETNVLLNNCNLPFMIKPNSIVLDEEIYGDRYQLLYSWVNPFNINKTMKVFSAQNLHDLINIRGVMVGDDHYVLMRNNETSKKGNFINNMNIWFCK